MSGSMRRRPHGIIEMGWACISCACAGRYEHAPIAPGIPESLIERFYFDAGGNLGWRLSGLRTPRGAPAPWKIVVITGAPSWAEYWADALADLPQDREMVVIDRPGFAFSEPLAAAPDIAVQARALSPLLHTAPGQRLLLVGQSYGGGVATLMAASQPEKVDSLMLLSAYLGEPGPTARRLMEMGSRVLNIIPRDLRNAIVEVRGQRAQMPAVRLALQRLPLPIHVVHGDQDDFAPIEVAKALAERTIGHGKGTFHIVRGANHFLNDGPTPALLAELERVIGLADDVRTGATDPTNWRPWRDIAEGDLRLAS
jgi:pimeloyl-ACP methyl ester carboxylesterase